LGQAAFFGLGAYVVGIAMTKYGISWQVAVLLGLLLSTGTAALTGLVAVRVTGLFFTVITLAVSQVFWGMSQRWGVLTGGWNGLRGIPRPFSVLESNLIFYYLGLAVFLVAGCLMYRMVHAPFGLALRGIKDSESRMSTSGYNVWLHKYIVFVICGMFAGVAGILYSFYSGFVSPGVLAVRTSFDAMLMVIIGGAGTLVGSVIGSAAIVTLRNYLSAYLDRWLIVLGLVFIVTTLYAPKGIVGWFRVWRGDASSREDIDVGAGDGLRSTVTSGRNPNEGTTEQAATRGEGANRREALRLENVSKSFARVLALDHVFMTVYAGSRMAIIGPNGAGKTTLFNTISGIYYPTAGHLSLFGRDITRLRPHVRANLGLARTFQITNLYPTLTALDNMRLGIMGIQRSKYLLHIPVARCREVNEQAEELLERVGLWNRRSTEVRNLSYGHQRQLELMMALASRPKILLLDEPTAGLSQAETKSMVKLVTSLDPTLTMLVIEHDMDVAFAIAEEVTVFANGQPLIRGTKEEIQASPAVREAYLGSPWV
jgi:branched-chain amino acid transport system ATP-binding protein